MPGLWPLVLTLASALLYTLAFPPASLAVFGWLALAPLFVAARLTGVGGAALLGLLWAQVVGFQLIDSLPAGVVEYFDRSVVTGWSFSALLFAINGGVQHAAALAVYRVLSEHFRATLPLLAGATWAAAELGRSVFHDALGPPSCQVAYTQAAWPAMLQIAALVGLYGISFLVVSANGVLAELALGWRQGAARRSLPAALAVVGLALASFAYGTSELARAQHDAEAEDEREVGRVPIAIVQGNLDPLGRWRPEHYGRNLDAYLELTLTAAAAAPDGVELVFWPESALTLNLVDDTAYRELIAEVLARIDADLVTGGPRVGPGEPPAFYNSVFLLSSAGQLLGHYDKQFLLPFAEYNPIWQVDLLQRSYGPARFWRSGQSTPPLETRAGPAGVFICNEVMLPGVAAERVRRGAAYLVAPANDGWLAGGWTPWPKWGQLMLDIARVRAIEQRRYVVRASTSGPSALIDPWGRVRARTDPDRAAVLIGGIAARDDVTLYARTGDAFAIACAIGTLLALARVLRERKAGQRTAR